ncbi:ATP synthase F0F1 subunit epsilon [Streptococcus pneumoniae]|uniref:Uncharacterized protein n=1 Tax=Streptococcus pneumoniae serotype 4 (strain ATCC BAA-334 / TIGR4) TaxID=170187 RepID=A0A0H2UR07_STRPN|nr:hypothetical protein SP_1490 [Streptococcus pneumoniae TIGR4]KYA54300.1 ATP synthase F0F1 subunit epsilon [Streptococcus pneumoniae]KYQ20802.1 ATP synthase F0F1 subunit epsilon [Streptococcus pneumoniae]KYQ26822.1 ATP synthase F0F1 subunit epsilon [Streptococcus pneumoniae]
MLEIDLTVLNDLPYSCFILLYKPETVYIFSK